MIDLKLTDYLRIGLERWVRLRASLRPAAASDASGYAPGQSAAAGGCLEAGHCGAISDGRRRVLASLAIGRQERRAHEAIGAAHDGHGHALVHGVHKPGLLRLAKHAVHRRRQVVESELHVEVGEEIFRSKAVLVDVVLLLRDWQHHERHAHLLLYH